jgi:hypothetical protein
MSGSEFIEMLELKLVGKCMIIPTLFVVGFWVFHG